MVSVFQLGILTRDPARVGYHWRGRASFLFWYFLQANMFFRWVTKAEPQTPSFGRLVGCAVCFTNPAAKDCDFGCCGQHCWQQREALGVASCSYHGAYRP